MTWPVWAQTEFHIVLMGIVKKKLGPLIGGISRHEYFGAPSRHVVVEGSSRVVFLKDHAGVAEKLPHRRRRG